MQSGYIKEYSRPILSLMPQFIKQSVRVFSLSLLCVSHSLFSLILELDYLVEL